MAAFDQSHMRGGFLPQQMLGDIDRPWTSRVDQCARGDDLPIAARIEHKLPVAALTIGTHQLGMRTDHRAALGRVDRVEHDQTRVVDPAVRIDEALSECALERLADWVM